MEIPTEKEIQQFVLSMTLSGVGDGKRVFNCPIKAVRFEKNMAVFEFEEDANAHGGNIVATIIADSDLAYIIPINGIIFSSRIIGAGETIYIRDFWMKKSHFIRCIKYYFARKNKNPREAFSS